MWKLIVLNLRMTILRNTLVFILLLTGLVISSLSFLYGFCALKSIRAEDRNYYDAARIYTLDALETVSYIEIRDNLDHFMQTNDGRIKRCELSLGRLGEMRVYCKGNGLSADFGSGFSGKTMPEIIIGSGLAGPDVQVGDHLKMYDVTYNVVGILEMLDYHVINSAGLANEIPVKQMEIFLDSQPSSALRKELDDILASSFPAFEVQSPEVVNAFDEYKLGSAMWIAILLVIIALVNLSYLYRYILLRRKHDYAVLRVLGCSRGKGKFILLSELYLLTVVQFFISSVLYRLLIDPVFARSSQLYAASVVSVQDYVVLLAVLLLLVGLIFLPVIKRYSSMSPARLKSAEMRWG